jgi:hypothetical protein
MTLLGKILVCVNLVISLMMAALGIGLYTQRINWTNQPPKATADKPQGELAARIEQIKDRWAALQLAEARQQTALAGLRTVEAQRPADQKWYAQQLDHMRQGADEKSPAPALVYQDGRLVLDDKVPTRPALVNGADRSKQPLRSLQAYARDIDERQKETLAARQKLTELVEEDTKLTQQMVGAKGLRQRLEDEEDKRQRVEQEIEEFVRPQLVNVLVESELLLKRRDALRGRIDELKRTVAAPGR